MIRAFIPGFNDDFPKAITEVIDPMPRIFAALCFLIVGSVCFSQTPRITGVQVTHYGIYTGNQGTRQPTASGVTYSEYDGLRLAETTRTVALQRGVNFGFEYTITGSPDKANVPIRIVVRFPAPGLNKPGSSTPLTDASFDLTKQIGVSAWNGYSIDEDWEMVPGQWSFEIWSNGQKLETQTFTLIP